METKREALLASINKVLAVIHVEGSKESGILRTLEDMIKNMEESDFSGNGVTVSLTIELESGSVAFTNGSLSYNQYRIGGEDMSYSLIFQEGQWVFKDGKGPF